jgi:hypothetical protein
VLRTPRWFLIPCHGCHMTGTDDTPSTPPWIGLRATLARVEAEIPGETLPFILIYGAVEAGMVCARAWRYVGWRPGIDPKIEDREFWRFVPGVSPPIFNIENEFVRRCCGGLDGKGYIAHGVECEVASADAMIAAYKARALPQSVRDIIGASTTTDDLPDTTADIPAPPAGIEDKNIAPETGTDTTIVSATTAALEPIVGRLEATEDPDTASIKGAKKRGRHRHLTPDGEQAVRDIAQRVIRPGRSQDRPATDDRKTPWDSRAQFARAVVKACQDTGIPLPKDIVKWASAVKAYRIPLKLDRLIKDITVPVRRKTKNPSKLSTSPRN